MIHYCTQVSLYSTRQDDTSTVLPVFNWQLCIIRFGVFEIAGVLSLKVVHHWTHAPLLKRCILLDRMILVPYYLPLNDNFASSDSVLWNSRCPVIKGGPSLPTCFFSKKVHSTQWDDTSAELPAFKWQLCIMRLCFYEMAGILTSKWV